MAMKTGGDNDEVMSEINVTPLVDVMLVLVIVFLVTAPLLTQSMNVNLPKTGAVAASDDNKSTPIGIDAQGRIVLDKTEIADLAQLEAKLREAVQQNPEGLYIVHADQAVSYAVVAKVLATAHKAGVNRLSLATVQE
ncbi:ExbD/TolR family protein [Methylococcus mesophilus]|uniref:ExbD/TolR family protein n=1 Tax=Methylococcus mesophilus TaxID=2993564 RepID=UPI00224B3FC5|nr:biopolymer transporter ExbD [Methylococcus mesophilus]UZR30898.1 biopolymer transporter ExbD [Methylococcus mesophilus]